MNSDDMDKRAEKVREEMKAERIKKIIDSLPDLLSVASVGSIEKWKNEQLEAMERLIDMTADHAKMKEDLHKAKIELQAVQVEKSAGEKIHEASEKDTEKMIARHNKVREKSLASRAEFREGLNKIAELSVEEMVAENVDDIVDMITTGKIKKEGEMFDRLSDEDFEKVDDNMARDLAQAMLKRGLISDEALEEQIEEIKILEPIAFKSMWRMVNRFNETENKESRKWGPGSEIANTHRDILFKGPKYADGVEKEVIIDEPNPRKSIQDIIKEGLQNRIKRNRPIFLTPYHKRGSIKDRKAESDLKTTEEPAFITELRQSRKLLEEFDESFASTRVDSLKAREAMLLEERKYNGIKLHENTSDLHRLIKEHIKSQRDFAIIDKIYKQAFKAFELADVEQMSIDEIKKALEGYQAERTIYSDLDMVWGSAYRSGDDSYYKWLERKRKSFSVEEATEKLGDLVSQIPSEMAEMDDRHKKSIDAVSPFNRS